MPCWTVGIALLLLSLHVRVSVLLSASNELDFYG